MSVNKPALCFPRKLVTDAEASSLVSYGDGKTAKLFSGAAARNLLREIASKLSLQDRTVCETDPDTAHLVVYPYLLQSSGVDFVPVLKPCSADSLQLFSYARTAKGDESRLYNKRSIGVGGHVDLLPEEQTLDSLLYLLSHTILEELKEEIGYYALVEPKNLRDRLYKTARNGLNILLNSDMLKLVYDDNDEVGCQHLGIVIPVTMPAVAICRLEDSMTDAHQWLIHSHKWEPTHVTQSANELLLRHDWESWSEILLRDIVQNGLPFVTLHEDLSANYVNVWQKPQEG